MKLYDGSAEYLRADDIRPEDTVRCPDGSWRRILAAIGGATRGHTRFICEDGFGWEDPNETRVLRKTAKS